MMETPTSSPRDYRATSRGSASRALHVRARDVRLRGWLFVLPALYSLMVRDPRPEGYGDPVYRTGDLVRLRPDGDYDFLGRRDHQIKSRGYRIELGEIEAALNSHPSLLEAVAVAIPHEEWGKAIVACVAVREGEEPAPNEIKKHLAERIPRYMIPARIDFLARLPRTSNGKIDRQRLQQEAAERGVTV